MALAPQWAWGWRAGGLAGLALASGLAGCCWLAQPPSDAVATDHAIIYCDAPFPYPEQVRQATEQQVQDLIAGLGLAAPPARVHLLAFSGSTAGSCFIAGRHPGRAFSRALCYVEDGKIFIALPRQGEWADTLTDLRHELTHYLLVSHFRDLPPWLDEGLARYCENGAPLGTLTTTRQRDAAAALAAATAPDYAALIAVPMSTPLSRAQYDLALGLTWLLVHEPGLGLAAARGYLATAVSGPAGPADFTRAFGVPVAALPAWVAARRGAFAAAATPPD